MNAIATAVKILNEAQEAGQQAYASCTPIPMVVQQHVDMLDDNSPVAKEWHIPEGVCGFAWILVKCNNTPNRVFINSLKKMGLATSDINSFKGEPFKKSSCQSGFQYWVQGSQSYERKKAYADAFAKVLINYGINAHSFSRLD